MREIPRFRVIRKPRPTYRETPLADGVPNRLGATIKKNPDLGIAINTLEEAVPLVLSQLYNTPEPVRAIVHRQKSPKRYIRSVFDGEADPADPNVPAVEQVRDNAFTIFTRAALTPTQEAQLSEINGHPALIEVRDRVARRGLRFHRPTAELRKFVWGGLVTAGAAVGATVLEARGAEGLGLLLAQATDDVANTFNVGASEEGGRKTVKEMFKDNWPVIPIVGVAAIADNTIIPQLLESPSPNIRLVGGTLFVAAAVAGSFFANAKQVRRGARELRGFAENTDLSKWTITKMAVKENLEHPFRRWLWAGMGLSLVTTEVAARAGILVGQGYSGTLQTVIGQLETITGFGGLFLTSTAVNTKERLQNWWVVRKKEEK